MKRIPTLKPEAKQLQIVTTSSLCGTMCGIMLLILFRKAVIIDT